MAEQQEQPTRSSEGFEARMKHFDLGQTRSYLASFIEFIAETRHSYSPSEALELIKRLWDLVMASVELIGIDEVDPIFRDVLEFYRGRCGLRDATSESE